MASILKTSHCIVWWRCWSNLQRFSASKNWKQKYCWHISYISQVISHHFKYIIQCNYFTTNISCTIAIKPNRFATRITCIKCNIRSVLWKLYFVIDLLILYNETLRLTNINITISVLFVIVLSCIWSCYSLETDKSCFWYVFVLSQDTTSCWKKLTPMKGKRFPPLST